ncbi:hypothetical protein F5Y05DRAFT_409896 [Hypoxylon sp. FL0543]|nr:hypothetical protein F5Y05DRAFT_409896 [Hypoxylon sp. FL0543]
MSSRSRRARLAQPAALVNGVVNGDHNGAARVPDPEGPISDPPPPYAPGGPLTPPTVHRATPEPRSPPRLPHHRPDRAARHTPYSLPSCSTGSSRRRRAGVEESRRKLLYLTTGAFSADKISLKIDHVGSIVYNHYECGCSGAGNGCSGRSGSNHPAQPQTQPQPQPPVILGNPNSGGMRTLDPQIRVRDWIQGQQPPDGRAQQAQNRPVELPG